MISKYDFIVKSMDLNVFFLRIMMEHSYFLEISFTPKEKQLISRAGQFRQNFEKLLCEAVELADNHVSCEAVSSGQFVTKYTMDAEKITEHFTGIPINTNITSKELALTPESGRFTDIEKQAIALNKKAYDLTAALIQFKEEVLNLVLTCKIFTTNYPQLIKHIIQEAQLYKTILGELVNNKNTSTLDDLIKTEIFWNGNMADHAKFIDGMLDPTEETLKNTARMLGKEFDELEMEARRAQRDCYEQITKKSIDATKRLRDFKAAGTEGIINCKIKSIIIPLLADHVLREANYYLCLLGVCRH